MADEFTPAEVASMFPEETPATPAPVETPVAEVPATPATPEPTPTPPATPAHNWDKGMSLLQQKLAKQEAAFQAQQAEMAEMKAALAKATTPPPAPDDLEELVKVVDDDDKYDTTIHGRQAVKKLLAETRSTRAKLDEISKATQAANARAEAAEQALAAAEAQRSEEARASQVWRQFEADNPAIKVSEAQSKWKDLAGKYSPEAATAAFETWKEFQPKASAIPAAPAAAPKAGPAIAPPARSTAPGSRPAPVVDDGEFTEEQLEQLSREIR